MNPNWKSLVMTWPTEQVTLWCYEEDNEILATFRMVRQTNFNIVVGVYVEEKSRGKGLGDKIMEKILNEISAEEKWWLLFDNANLPACRLYKKWNWKRSKREVYLNEERGQVGTWWKFKKEKYATEKN